MITVIDTLSGSYFSATIPDVVFSITGLKAGVTMAIDGKEIYSEFLYPIDGRITISELSNLITPYALQKLKVSLSISLREEMADGTAGSTSSISANIIYCAADIGTDCQSFIDSQFLSVLQGTKTTAMGRLEYLHYIGTDRAWARVTFGDGSTKDISLDAVGGNGRYTTLDVSPQQFMAGGGEPVAYTVTAGNRHQDFVVDPDTPDCAPILLFENSFGCEELLYCTGTATLAPTFKRDTAFINGKQKNYHIEETRTMKADTGIMTHPECEWAQELFRSPFIRVVNFMGSHPNVGREVIITDDKVEVNNADDALPRITFSYQYAQRNQNVVDLNRAGRIFDNTFDNTFN